MSNKYVERTDLEQVIQPRSGEVAFLRARRPTCAPEIIHKRAPPARTNASTITLIIFVERTLFHFC